MNHVICSCRPQQPGTTPSIHLLPQRQLNRKHPNMHGRHLVPEIGRRIIKKNYEPTTRRPLSCRCHNIAIAYRHNFHSRFTGLDPRAYASRKRPVRRRGPNHIIMSLFEPHFWPSFQVGNAGQSCAESGFVNCQDDLLSRRRCAHSTQVVFKI